MSFEVMKAMLIRYWPLFLRGAGITILISIIGTVIGSIIGLLVGLVRTTPLADKGPKRIILKIIDKLLGMYIGFFRGTPMMVQAMVLYFGTASAFGLQIDRTFAAILIVSINTGAYMAEIVRGGINSVDKGQFEAAHAMGMNHVTTMKEIILPQVIKNILPATGNEFVVNIKDTSMLSVIGVSELFFQTNSIAGNNFKYAEAFFITSVIYLFMTLTVTWILRRFENKLEGPASYSMIDETLE
nr:amino acid ABC transporter permease [Tissierella sp.]